MISRRRRRQLRPIVAMIFVSLLLGQAVASRAARSPYKKGTSLRLEGRILGPEGEGVPGAVLILTAQRQSRRLLVLGGEDRGPVAAKARSVGEGQYAFDWIWDRYHDRFGLEVVLEATAARQREVLASLDVTDRLTGANPIRIDIEVPDASRIRFANRVGAGDLSAEERRVLSEMGPPARYAERQQDSGGETEWWYFDRGRMYRFEAGALAQVVHFDPVLSDE